MSARRALVAEDSAHILFSLEMLLEQSGVVIVGAAATVAGMRKLAETIDAEVAILDVNLNGELIFPVADLLIERGVPVIFTTGYAPEKLFPPRFMGLPTLQKPYDPDEFLNLVEEALAQTRVAHS
ncbi:response regulator [Rhodoblastus sp.]|uniref:response regulator n=1 Tax=Rhodoblastus sp. TaxID=1962975 RepID=UPI003F9EA882